MINLAALTSKVAPITQSTTMLVDEVDSLVPDVVPGSEIHIDGDSAAYQCAGKDGTPLTTCKKRFREFIANKMAAAGAEFANVCFTGGDGSKGGRYLTAVTQPYQEKRVGIQRPENLPALREWALNEYAGKALDIREVLKHRPDKAIVVVETSEEADDAMSQLQHAFLEKGLQELSIICAEDKDLFMNEGKFMDWNTHEITDAVGYGYIKLYETPGGTKKIVGRGRSFFFAQLLVGDTADNIPGLPYFTPTLCAQEFPTSDIVEQKRRLSEGTMPSGKELTEKQVEAARKKLKQLIRNTKSKPCGPVAVLDYLSECATEREALVKVLRAYTAYYGECEEVLNPHTNETMQWTPLDFLLENARLLWMRRTYGEDALTYLKEIK